MEIGFTSDGRVLLWRRAAPNLIMEFTAEEWKAFLAGVRAGEFDIFDMLDG